MLVRFFNQVSMCLCIVSQSQRGINNPLYVYMYVCMYECMYVYLYAYDVWCVCVCLFVCASMYVCMYVFIHVWMDLWRRCKTDKIFDLENAVSFTSNGKINFNVL